MQILLYRLCCTSFILQILFCKSCCTHSIICAIDRFIIHSLMLFTVYFIIHLIMHSIVICKFYPPGFIVRILVSIFHCILYYVFHCAFPHIPHHILHSILYFTHHHAPLCMLHCILYHALNWLHGEFEFSYMFHCADYMVSTIVLYGFYQYSCAQSIVPILSYVILYFLLYRVNFIANQLPSQIF